MSRTHHHGERRIRVRGIRRKQPDLSKLARALIELAQAQAEKEAEEQHAKRPGEVAGAPPKEPSRPERDAA